MSSTRTPLDDALTTWGRLRGFRRKTTNWRRVNLDTIHVVNLQKSNYGFQYYLNFGIWLRPVDPAETSPQDFKCQLRARVGKFNPHQEKEIARILDLESDLTDTERESAVIALMETSMTDELLAATSSIANLQRPEQDQPTAVMLFSINVIGRELLGRPLHGC